MLTEGSVQDHMARMQLDLKSVLQAVKGTPLDVVPTGEAGLPAEAIIRWGERARQTSAGLDKSGGVHPQCLLEEHASE